MLLAMKKMSEVVNRYRWLQGVLASINELLQGDRNISYPDFDRLFR